MLAVMAAQMLLVIRQKSITVDEWVLIPAGYYHLTEGDFRPVNEHPPFAKILSALPLLTSGAVAPPIDPAPRHDYGYFLGLFSQFWHSNAERLDTLAFWARVPAVMTTLLLGALVFHFARRHWGARAALFATLLFTLEPTVLAHGRVVQTDIPSALSLLLFAFALYEYLKGPTAARAALVGLCAGLAAVTKFSMIVLGPLLLLLMAALLVFAPRRGLRRASVAGHAVALGVAAVLAVNAAYLFRNRAPEPLDEALRRLVVPAGASESLRAPLEFGYLALQKIFPADFIYGIGWQMGHAHEGHAAGLLGEHSQHGWWYYFPVAFALKTTLPFLLLSAAALLWAVLSLRRGADGRVLVLVLPAALFTALLMMSTINIGVRYMLPAYPFLCILCGAFLDRVMVKKKHQLVLGSLVVAAPLAWAGVEAVRAYPDHMSYTNQLTRGAPDWWHLSDSNVEWGDDVRPLALYLRERGERRVGAALLNWQLLELYGLEMAAVFVPPGEAREDVRYVAIGASLLNGSTVPGGFDNGVRLSEEERVNYFDEFRRREPEKVFGNSIYLYRMK